MRPAILLFLVFSSLYAHAQKPPIKFGDISKEELELTIYDRDSSAVAVVLTDYGHAYISLSTSKLIFERHKRVKILKKEGLDYANAAIRLYYSGSAKETVSNLKGVTYNMVNGKLTETKMSKQSIFEEKFSKNINLYKFAFEDVQVGSIIEYSYKVNSEFFYNFPNWQFQYSIPVIWSEYRADIPEFFTYQKYMQGYVSTTIFESPIKFQGQNSYTANRWVVKNAPAFKEEAFMTCEDDYISRINFALSYYKIGGITYEIMGTWEKLRKILNESESFGRVVDNSGFLNKTVKELTANVTDPEVKIKIIYDYIKENIAWDGESDFETAKLKDAFKAKKGTSADINLGLASMLREAGFDVELIILSTRENGFVRTNYAMVQQFNYVVCQVNLGDKTIILDATDRNLPQNILPERCLNGQGLLISKTKGVEWIDLEFSDKTKSLINVTFAMDEGGSLKGNIDFSKTRYDASNMRKQYKSNGEEEYIKNMVSGKSWNISDQQFTSLDNLDMPTSEHFDVEITDHVMMAGQMAYINPFVLSKIQENPFKSIEREYPVDFGSPFDKMYVGKFTIPENYAIEELPKSKIITLPDNGGKYLLNVAQVGNSITVVSSFSINKGMFTQMEYPNLREFYNLIVATQSEQIVLKKIN